MVQLWFILACDIFFLYKYSTTVVIQQHMQDILVFGMVDTSQTPALGFIVTVPDRRAQTLLPIMQRHLRKGTTIYSDSWVAYRSVQQLPAVSQHGMVKHSLNFVDPVSDVHTQNVESYWNRVKTKFKKMKVVHEAMLMSYLDEFMWREGASDYA